MLMYGKNQHNIVKQLSFDLNKKKTVERAQSQQQRRQWFLMDGGAYLSDARSWSSVPLCAAGDRQDTGAGT